MSHPRLLPALLVGLVTAAWAVAYGPRTVASRPIPHAPSALRVLIVGGGPDLSHNQVAIESNVRYLERLLPTDSQRRVLFADGSLESKTVLYTDSHDQDRYRQTQIPKLDGPARLDAVSSELTSIAGDLATSPSTPVLLYFTGHGSPDRREEFVNNRYDLWGGERLTVTRLATAVQAFPTSNPIALVMVECYSGAFGNVLFRDGNPDGQLSDQAICGFFASAPNRMAAGCTPNVNEAEYRDFTGYFFAALSGVDRLGRPVTGADYDHNGRVGMDEAFAYALLHDDSIDTPVCTSDTFLRRFVKMPEQQIFDTSYGSVRRWASPGQRAALDGLAELLRYSGDALLHDAYDDFLKTNADSETDRAVHLIRFVRLAKSVVLSHALRTSSDEPIKHRFEALLRLEAGNPLREAGFPGSR